MAALTDESWGGGLWRGWSAACLLAGVVLAPLFLEVFSGGRATRFLALPLRLGWLLLLLRPVLKKGWLPGWGAGVLFAGPATALSVVTLVDLAGWRVAHPGWFLALEWWQRPLYPWLALIPGLPDGLVLERPAYIWVLSTWTLLEGALVGRTLRVWAHGGGGFENGVAESG